MRDRYVLLNMSSSLNKDIILLLAVVVVCGFTFL